MFMQNLLGFVAAAIAILTLVGLIHRMFLKKVINEARDSMAWLRKFQRDWDGEPAGAGRDAVPGVMERLNRIDGELKRNGGSTLKDKVFETFEKAEELESRVTTIELRQCEIQEALKKDNRG